MLNHRSGEATLTIIAILFFVVMMLLLTLLGVPLEISTAVIIGCLIFIISFVNTDLALIILIFTMLLSPEFNAGEVSGRTIKIRADDIFIIIIFLGWIAKMAIHKELGFMKSTRLNYLIVIYSVICLLSSFAAIIQGRVNISTSMFYLLKYIEYFLLFFLVSNNLKTVAQAKKFIFYLLLTCFIVCVYALMSGAAGGRVSAPFESGAGGEPNTFAGYLIVMMSLMLGLIFNAAPGGKRFILIGLFFMSIIAFLLTLSRSGWVGFFASLAAFTFFNKKHRILLIASLMIAVMILPMVAPKSVQRRVNETFSSWRTYKVMGKTVGLDESASARIDSWGVGFKRWSKRPILGYGIPAGAVIDNQYTRVLNETGIIGFIAFIAILFAVFRAAYKVYKTMPGDDFAQALSIGFLAGFMGLLIFSSAAATFIIIRIMEPFWFMVAIIAVLPDLKKDDIGAEVI
ncbi:MAG: O-antigen ligase family protein [Candidatus Omnitrophica bacterium]|nr:O-antigen ligase family protein [Candidatus Omnitrophota bacterium]MBU1807943.1 O-antigen ligase family protein [Candidatus Omnitrophota bacterium]